MESYQDTQDYRDFAKWKDAVHSASTESISRVAKADPSRIYGGHEREDDKSGHRFGTFLQAVRMAANGDSGPITRELSKRAAAGMNETVPSAGGFAVDQPVANEILDVMYGEGTIAGLCRKIPVTVGNGLKIPAVDSSSRVDGSRPMRGYWVEEAGTITAKSPAMKSVNFEMRTLAAIVPVTQALLDDAPALEAWLLPAATRELSYCLDRAIIRGSGAGAPLGILNSPCLVTQAAEGAQLADTVLAENVIKMRSRRTPGLGRWTWLYNPNAFSELQSMTLAGTNAPAFVPIGGLNGLPYDTLLGDKIVECEHCSTLGNVGDVVYGCFDQYILAQRGALRSDTSIHVYFDSAQVAYRFLLRVDGQPSLPSPVTLEQSGTTTSAFVTLAARA